MSQGFYELLGIDEDAAPDAVRTAYQRRLAQLVRRLRDARRQGADVSILESQERELRGAMDVLEDPVRRRRYDAFRAASRQGMPTDAEGLWEQARASMIDPSSALALALVRALTNLPVGDPLPLPPEHRVRRVGHHPAPQRTAPAPHQPPVTPAPAVPSAAAPAAPPPAPEPEVRPTAVPATDPGLGALPHAVPGRSSVLADLTGGWFKPAAPAAAEVEDAGWDEDYTDGDFADDEGLLATPAVAAVPVEDWTDEDFDDERYDEDLDDLSFGDERDQTGPLPGRSPAMPGAQPAVAQVQLGALQGRSASPGPSPDFVMPAPSLPSLPTDPIARMAVQHGLTGSFLRAVREHQGMSVDELSRATRISTRYLGAIEDDAHDRLPSATFVRGYLKQVQRALELSDHDVVDAFMDAYRAARG